MAAYVTQADLVERFGSAELAQLTDESAATSQDVVEIGKACDEASSLIDAYLSTRYTLPLTDATTHAASVPTMVRKWACDIARKFLWKDRAGADSVVTLNYEDAIAQLKDVAKGVAGLPGAGGTQVTGAGGFARTTPTAVFDTTGLLGNFGPSRVCP